MAKINGKKVLRLLREITKLEIIARFGKSKGLAFGDYALLKRKKEDELREYLYGTSDLIKLGKQWKLLNKVWTGPPTSD